MFFFVEIEEFNEGICCVVSGSFIVERKIWVILLSYCFRKMVFLIYFNMYNFFRSWEVRIGIVFYGWFGEVVRGVEFEIFVEYDFKDGWKFVGKVDVVKGDYFLEFKFRGFENNDLKKNLKKLKKNIDLDYVELFKELIE